MMLGFSERKVKVLAMVHTAHKGLHTTLLSWNLSPAVPFALSSSCPDGYKNHSPTCSVDSG